MKPKTQELLDRLYITDYPVLYSVKDDIMKAFSLMKKCAEEQAFVYCCGNGGSAADSEHITGELMKGFLLRRPLSESEKECFKDIESGEEIADKLQRGVRCISLVSQTGLISAFANDVDPSLVFAQQVFAYAKNPNDVLIALSTSGNSANIVNAVKAAKAAGIKSVSITGENESRLSELSDVTIRLPSKETYKIQELTLPVYHALCAATEAEMFGENK